MRRGNGRPIAPLGDAWCTWRMERVANKAHGFGEALAWELGQYAAMTPDERRRVAKALRDRFYGKKCPDVRDVVAGSRHVRRRA
jgi:hypothetical protein